MKHPFWIINSSLLLLLIFVVGFIFFSRPTIPRKVSFEPDAEMKPIKKEITKIDVSKIYTNDLFGTYQAPIQPIIEPTKPSPMPQPPLPKPPPIPQAPPPKFLEPLKINLRGIITASDERMNVAMLEDATEKKSKNYKEGDKIQDAQLIRILKNKIILIRSNGQEETLYVSQHDAELEQLLLPQNNWSTIITQVDTSNYTIDPQLFVERIHSLAQFIDLLNLSTVYQKGKSIGCRIGNVTPNSLPAALGFASGDIIQEINALPAIDTPNRFEIYKSVIATPLEGTITLKLSRQNQPVELSYTLVKTEDVSMVETPTQIQEQLSITIKTPEEIEAEKVKILEQKYRFAPTAQELQKKEKEAMLKMSKNQQRPHARQARGVISSTTG